MRRAVAIACGALLLAGAVAGGVTFLRDPVPAPAASPPFLPSSQRDGALHGRSAFLVPPPQPSVVLTEVREALETSYYRYVPESVLDEPSVRRILSKLDDPFTEYLSPAAYESLREELTRDYYGIGLTVGPGVDGLLVTSSLEGPARKAGIRAGDVIVSIDGQPASKLPFDRSISLIKGEEGTVVRLTIRRPGEKRSRTFLVVRRPIDVPSVRARMLNRDGHHHLGYVRILSFREDVAVRVAEATDRLVRKGAEGLVIDLRGDPGGLLSEAIAVTSLYLDHGLVCSTSSLRKTRSYFVTGNPVEGTLPMVVLVDRATASAAEITAAALAENDRAVLVGERTFGKASIQTLVDLSNGGGLKLTTATYLTPSGTSIRGRGIKPQVKALDDPLTRPDEGLVAASQALLEHL